MPRIITTIKINAPIERVFDLSRSLDFHAYSQKHRKEVAVGGKTSGLINLGEKVTWRATHLGVPQELTVEITKFDQPYTFRDSMVRGAFKRFDHDHIFEQVNGGVKVTDIFDYNSPLSILGKIFDFLVLKRYMTRFSTERNRALKQALESDSWKAFLNNHS